MTIAPRPGGRAAPAEGITLPACGFLHTLSVMASAPPASAPGFTGLARSWIDRNFLALGREMRLSYLPPLMVYVAAGISGLTSIVATFYIKERLGLSAEFLAGLAFWAGLPWALKVPLGHLVDLIWRWKGALVFAGAGLIAASVGIMIGLLGSTESMRALWSVEAWFVFSTLLAPIGYVVQDVVADAMTVEAVPRFDAEGRPTGMAERKSMNTTVQTLGRVAIIGGTVLVSLANVYLLRGVGELTAATVVAEVGDFRRFARANGFMNFSGLTASEHSSGEKQLQGPITKAGNSNLRHVFIQAAHNARHQPQPRARLRARHEGAPADLVEMAARAQERLYHRYWYLARRIGREKAVVAVARELAGFVWAMGQRMSDPAQRAA